MKSVSFEPEGIGSLQTEPTLWRACLPVGRYFQHEQTLFVNRTADEMLKEKGQVKWVGYIFPSPLIIKPYFLNILNF